MTIIDGCNSTLYEHTLNHENRLDEFDRKLRSGGPEVFEVMAALIQYLDEARAVHGEGWPAIARACRGHKLHHLLLEDPYTSRAFTKPRGYAGDAATLDLVYGHPAVRSVVAGSSGMGRSILGCTGGESLPARAVRWRRARIASEIEAVAAEHRDPHILAFACGHLREVELIDPKLRRRVRITAADMDQESLQVVARAYAREVELECRRLSVKDLITGSRNFESSFDLIYALGLFDYLTDKVARRLILAFLSLAAAKGKVIIANFTTATQGAGYMEAMMDWWLHYRTENELAEWGELVGSQQSAGREIFSDPFGQVCYLSLQR